jgi:broad specificity phosphatase PhoE
VTRFVLVRHGVCAQTDSVLLGRAVDAPLDERGRRQAAKLASWFDERMNLAVEASPRRRTQETAAAIADQVGASVSVAPALDEVDFGRWAGASFAELAHDGQWRAWNERRGIARTPAGDSMGAVQKRVLEYLHVLRERQPARTLVLVTHAEVIRAVLMHCLSAPLDEYWRHDIAPASCTTLSVRGAAFCVERVNAPAPAFDSPECDAPACDAKEPR